MPRSAIDTGVVDLVLHPRAMPEPWRYNNCSREQYHAQPVPGESGGSLRRDLAAAARDFGIDFSHYKPSTVQRRVERRLVIAPVAGSGRIRGPTATMTRRS